MWGGVGDYQPRAGNPAAWLRQPSLVDPLNMYACDPVLACNNFRPNYDALKMPVSSFTVLRAIAASRRSAL
eukprot:SAG22_NODE_1954_length_3263_cov_1.817952_1_plen_71_part_00